LIFEKHKDIDLKMTPQEQSQPILLLNVSMISEKIFKHFPIGHIYMLSFAKWYWYWIFDQHIK
jgi:hypothetical protein